MRLVTLSRSFAITARRVCAKTVERRIDDGDEDVDMMTMMMIMMLMMVMMMVMMRMIMVMMMMMQLFSFYMRYCLLVRP